MEIQNVKGVEIARVETVSACFSFLPRFSRGYQGPLARLSGLSAGLMLLNSLSPRDPPSLRHWTLNSLLSLDLHDTSPSLSPQPDSIPTSGHILSISFAGSCNPKFDLDLGSWVLHDLNGLLISLSPLSPTLLPSFLTLLLLLNCFSRV